MAGLILDEQTAFQRVIDGLKLSADGARLLALHQPDKAHMWNKMAEVYLVAAESAYRLSAERAMKQSLNIKQ